MTFQVREEDENGLTLASLPHADTYFHRNPLSFRQLLFIEKHSTTTRLGVEPVSLLSDEVLVRSGDDE